MEKSKERFIPPLDTKDMNKAAADTSLYTIEYPKISLDSLAVPEKNDKQIRNILTKIKNYDLLYNKFDLRQIDRSVNLCH